MFVRQDLTLAQQIIQTNHATFEMAYTLSQSVDDLVPSLVLIGVPNKKALERVIAKLKLHHIDASAFYEPDNDLGLTAVVTVPLDEEQRAVLQNYKLWSEKNVSYAPSSVVRAPLQSDGGPRFESLGAYQRAGSSAMQGFESPLPDQDLEYRDWARSGSAPVLGTGGRGFESHSPDHGAVAQTDRAVDYESTGRGFDSLRPLHRSAQKKKLRA